MILSLVIGLTASKSKHVSIQLVELTICIKYESTNPICKARGNFLQIYFIFLH